VLRQTAFQCPISAVKNPEKQGVSRGPHPDEKPAIAQRVADPSSSASPGNGRGTAWLQQVVR